MKTLVAGWFSFKKGYATAGDLESLITEMDVVVTTDGNDLSVRNSVSS